MNNASSAEEYTKLFVLKEIYYEKIQVLTKELENTKAELAEVKDKLRLADMKLQAYESGYAIEEGRNNELEADNAKLREIKKELEDKYIKSIERDSKEIATLREVLTVQTQENAKVTQDYYGLREELDRLKKSIRLAKHIHQSIKVKGE